MDITLYTFSKIPDMYYEYSIYTGKYMHNVQDLNISRNRWTSFFWVSSYSQNILFQYLTDFWHTYWKENDELIEYFLIDYAIELGYKKIPAIKKELDAIPMNSCGSNVWTLLKILPQAYNENIINDIKKNNWMQKLSYKGEGYIQTKTEHPEKSNYNRLFLQ